MDRGTYIAASGGLLEFKRLDIVNNNLANVNTPGFKRQVLVSSQRTFDETLASRIELDDPYALSDHERTPEAESQGAYTDFSPGPIRETGNALDVALNNPKDFFVVNTPRGPEYTRAGSFTLSAEGALVTPDGHEVQGDGGTLTLQAGAVSISANGAVMLDGAEVGRLQVVRFQDPSLLERVGGTRFRVPQGAAAASETVEADVVPRSLEMSNVSTVTSMIDLVAANRAFEMYEKTARTIDELNGTATQQIGRYIR